MGFSRARALQVTADGANNQTGWLAAKKGAVVIIRGTITGAVTLQRRNADGQIVDVTDNLGVVTTFTAVGTYTVGPFNTPSEYRLNAKQGAVSNFPFNMSIEGK